MKPVQDFFKPQPTDREVSVFLLKQILHDWSDEYCVKILAQLRTAARKDTRLLVVDSLVPYACHDANEGDNALDIPGSVPHEAPAPLLANYGLVNEMVYAIDIDVSNFSHLKAFSTHGFSRCSSSSMLRNAQYDTSRIFF